MWCVKCGEKARPGSRFCRKCGAPLREATAQAPAEPERPARPTVDRRRALLIGGAGILVVLIVAGAAALIRHPLARQADSQATAQETMPPATSAALAVASPEAATAAAKVTTATPGADTVAPPLELRRAQDALTPSTAPLTPEQKQALEALSALCLSAYNATLGQQAAGLPANTPVLETDLPAASYLDLLLGYLSLNVADANDPTGFQSLADVFPVPHDYSFENGCVISTDSLNTLLRSCFPSAGAERIELTGLPFAARREGDQWTFAGFEADGGGMPFSHVVAAYDMGDVLDVFFTQHIDFNLGDGMPSLYCMRVRRDASSIFGYSMMGFERLENGPAFTSAKASTTLQDDGHNYDAANVLDGDDGTAWVEGAKGYGIGEWVELSASAPQLCFGLSIEAGYMKDYDTFAKNGRVRTLRVEADGQTVYEGELRDEELANQIIPFSQAVEASALRITILGTYPGEKYEDTCISEIAPY